jgi:DNA-binding transcriptional ArsR family regulator
MTNNPDAILSALADPARRRVVELLHAGPRPAGALARAVGASPSMMSRHLRVLAECRLVEDERGAADARQRVFRLRPEPLGTVRSWLEEMQAAWNDRLAAFKRHADATSAKRRAP